MTLPGMGLSRNNIIIILGKVGTLDGIRGGTTARRYNPKPRNDNPNIQFNQKSQYYTGKDRVVPSHFPKEPAQTDHQGDPSLLAQTASFAMGHSKELVKPL